MPMEGIETEMQDVKFVLSLSSMKLQGKHKQISVI